MQSSGYLYVRNISESGYGTLLNSRGTTRIQVEGEFFSHPAVSLFDSILSGLNLEVEEIPNPQRDHPDTWINVADFGAIPGTDVTEAVRAAIAATTPERGTIYFPNTSTSLYLISDTVEIGGNVRRIVGMNARIKATAALRAQEKPKFRLVDGNSEWLVIEQFFIPWGTAGAHTLFANERSQGTVFQYIFATQDQFYDGRKSTGHTHFIDITAGHDQNDLGPPGLFHFGAKERIWARQLNPEINDGHIINEGGDVWILGLKTEREGPIITNRHGGRMEVIGAMIHPRNIGVPATMQIIINDQADISFIGREANSNEASYQVLAEVQRAGQFARLMFSNPVVPREIEGSRQSFVLPLFVERGAFATPVRGALATRRLAQDSIDLSWDSVPLADHYRIYRGVQRDGSDRTLITTTANTFLSDNNLPVGSTFWYWIDPIADGSSLGLSSAFEGSTAPGLAQAPAIVTASFDQFPDRILVQWERVQGASLYFFWRNTSSDFATATRLISLSPNTITAYEDTAVSPGQTYYYWIQPFTIGFGSGPVSEVAVGRAGTPQTWAGFPLQMPARIVDTGDFLGSLLIHEPFVWSQALQNWLYLPESFVEQQGTWTYVLRD
ncbi:MAG: hypothetical protein LR015_09505 [Verrucomicrobia bacterium]|nr:hypothetical protein [Verrucomicrobiota bacterium]